MIVMKIRMITMMIIEEDDVIGEDDEDVEIEEGEVLGEVLCFSWSCNRYKFVIYWSH